MAITTGTKTMTDNMGVTHTIEVLRVILGGGSGTSPDSAIYRHIGGGGKPTQEFSMTETQYLAQGWQNV